MDRRTGRNIRRSQKVSAETGLELTLTGNNSHGRQEMRLRGQGRAIHFMGRRGAQLLFSLAPVQLLFSRTKNIYNAQIIRQPLPAEHERHPEQSRIHFLPTGSASARLSGLFQLQSCGLRIHRIRKIRTGLLLQHCSLRRLFLVHGTFQVSAVNADERHDWGLALSPWPLPYNPASFATSRQAGRLLSIMALSTQ